MNHIHLKAGEPRDSSSHLWTALSKGLKMQIVTGTCRVFSLCTDFKGRVTAFRSELLLCLIQIRFWLHWSTKYTLRQDSVLDPTLFCQEKVLCGPLPIALIHHWQWMLEKGIFPLSKQTYLTGWPGNNVGKGKLRVARIEGGAEG